MTLTKDRIIANVYNNAGLSRLNAKSTVANLIEKIKSTLESGEDVLITGFGKFCVKKRKERRGRNPRTGEDIVLDAGRNVSFKCSSVLREKMNGRG